MTGSNRIACRVRKTSPRAPFVEQHDIRLSGSSRGADRSEQTAIAKTINHAAEEYVRGDVTTNSVEDYFSIFK